MAKIPRNKQCPCGSGKKFKHCCLRASQMQAAARVPMDRAPELLDWLADLLGQAWVNEQIEAFREYQRAPARLLTIPGFHPLVPGLADRAGLPQTASPSNPLKLSRAVIMAATHAYDLQLVRQHVPPALKSRKLLGRLRSKRNAGSLLFELAIAVHYLLQGCIVTLPELADDSNLDLLLNWRAKEIEIQCKQQAEGSGRKVPNPSFKRLTLMIADAWRSADGEFAIVVQCADRLNSSHLQALAQEISSRFAEGWQGETKLMNGAYWLGIERKGPADHRVPAETLEKELAPFFADLARPPHLALLDQLPVQLEEPTAPVSPAYFLCSSRQRDTVLDNVMDSFREGARQLSGTRPGIVAVHVPELITQQTLDRMKRPTALGDALRHEFEDPGRSLSKAAAVVISGENFWPFQQGEWSSGFSAVIFRNESADLPLPDDFALLGRLPATSEPTR